MWGKGHSILEGNQRPEGRAKLQLIVGRFMRVPNIAALVGIRLSYSTYQCLVQMAIWDREVSRGLVFIYTDRGSLKHGFYTIRNSVDLFCECRIIHNAAQLLGCRYLGMIWM